MINPEMTFFEVNTENVKEEIKKWYDKDKYHFVTINATDIGGKAIVDWIFADYKEKNVMYVFRAEVDFEEKIPTITDLIPSTWVAEWELKDLFGLDFENAPEGLFLKYNENVKAPLRKDSNGK